MKYLALIFLALVATTLAAHSYKHEFKKFQKKFNKTYAPSEVAYRYQVFQDNMKRAAELQAVNPRATFGATKFSDLTPEEFARFYLMNKNFTRDYVAPAKKTFFPKSTRFEVDPTNWDWSTQGVCTPIYNQGQCGSCWAFSATETIESYFVIDGAGPLTELSPQQIVDCDTGGQDQGCNGGFPSGAYSYVQSAGGLEPLADYPYTAEDGTCQFQQSEALATVTGSSSISGESGLYSQLSSAGPVSVCVDASSWQSYSGGVLSTCGTSVDHCVQATGYANYNQQGAYWIVRNSWGADWGESGFIWVAIGQDLCDIGDYATVTTDGKA